MPHACGARESEEVAATLQLAQAAPCRWRARSRRTRRTTSPLCAATGASHQGARRASRRWGDDVAWPACGAFLRRRWRRRRNAALRWRWPESQAAQVRMAAGEAPLGKRLARAAAVPQRWRREERLRGSLRSSGGAPAACQRRGVASEEGLSARSWLPRLLVAPTSRRRAPSRATSTHSSTSTTAVRLTRAAAPPLATLASVAVIRKSRFAAAARPLLTLAAQVARSARRW